MIITADQFKTAKGIESNDFDEQIESLIPMVNEAIAKYCGREFDYAEYTDRKEGVCDARGMYLFNCQNKPIDIASGVSVDLFYYGIPGNPTSVDSTKLDIFDKTGVVKYAYGMTNTVYTRDTRQDFYYDITYVGGYASCDMPEGLKLGAVNALSDLFNHYYGDQIASDETARMGEKSKIDIDDYSETRVTAKDKNKLDYSTNNGFIFSQTTKNLLAPYKRMGLG